MVSKWTWFGTKREHPNWMMVSVPSWYEDGVPSAEFECPCPHYVEKLIGRLESALFAKSDLHQGCIKSLRALHLLLILKPDDVRNIVDSIQFEEEAEDKRIEAVTKR